MDNLFLKKTYACAEFSDIGENKKQITQQNFLIQRSCGLSLYLCDFRIYIYIIYLSRLTYNEMHKFPRDSHLGCGMFVREPPVP